MLARLERDRASLPAPAQDLAERLLAASRRPVPPDSHADPGRGRGAEDPLSRRFPSRPGHRRAERFLHHRFRGRAGAAARRAPAQEFAVARCRRHDPLVRLRQLSPRCGSSPRRGRRRSRECCSWPRPGGSGRSTAFAPPIARRCAVARPIRRARSRHARCWRSSRSKRRSTRCRTSWPTGPAGSPSR